MASSGLSVEPEASHSAQESAYDKRLPKWSLYLQAYSFRILASFGLTIAYWIRWWPAATSKKWIDSTLSVHKGPKRIRLDIYEPQSSSHQADRKKRRNSDPAPVGRPCIINFHGGGFVIGAGTDDAVWAQACNERGISVISVSYRLAPRYPFPTGVQDGTDAILWVWNNATSLGIDRDRLYLSGFSAGANIALTSCILFNRVVESSINMNKDLPKPNIRGIVSFYPVTDWSIPRSVKQDRTIRPDLSLPAWMSRIFVTAYLPRGIDGSDPLLSPARASKEALDHLPPVHLCLCEYDMLFQEGLDFAVLLKERGNSVGVRVVKGVKHGWDKSDRHPVGRDEEYGAALDAIQSWTGERV
jgi:acetyl esterase/lipase